MARSGFDVSLCCFAGVRKDLAGCRADQSHAWVLWMCAPGRNRGLFPGMAITIASCHFERSEKSCCLSNAAEISP
ncbi:MAG TPA: hypothetical protein PKX28_05365, partial [Candidatus Hydrogenedentes bacterium]|nr:hypothetical protein [Candidatus Hydrogenedentota bacterium]